MFLSSIDTYPEYESPAYLDIIPLDVDVVSEVLRMHGEFVGQNTNVIFKRMVSSRPAIVDGIRINCEGEANLQTDNLAHFSLVTSSHPIWMVGLASDLTQLLEFPLYVMRVQDMMLEGTELKWSGTYHPLINELAAPLLVRFNPEPGENWNIIENPEWKTPGLFGVLSGTVLAVRTDGKILTHYHIHALYLYYTRVLLPKLSECDATNKSEPGRCEARKELLSKYFCRSTFSEFFERCRSEEHKGAIPLETREWDDEEMKHKQEMYEEDQWAWTLALYPYEMVM